MMIFFGVDMMLSPTPPGSPGSGGLQVGVVLECDDGDGEKEEEEEEELQLWEGPDFKRQLFLVMAWCLGKNQFDKQFSVASLRYFLLHSLQPGFARTGPDVVLEKPCRNQTWQWEIPCKWMF